MLASWIKCKLLERSRADVYLAVDKETGKLFVVKTCNCDDKRTTREILNEITIFLVLETPRVVQYLGSSFTHEDGGEKLNLYLEYMPGGSLRKHISRLGGRLEESLIKTYTRDILEGLHHLHCKGIVHGDIKADNILVGVDGVKLCDFGGSKFVDHDSRGAMRGTPAWMAPEVVAKLDQGFPSDVWSLGCTVLEMATGQDPWGKVPSKTELRSIQLSRKIPDLSALSAEGQRFAKRCLVRNPKERWTAAQLLEEEFILNETVDSKTAAMSPALARIRATFPDPPGKRVTVKLLGTQKPQQMPSKIAENISTSSKLAPARTLDAETHESEDARSAVGARPLDSGPKSLQTSSGTANVPEARSFADPKRRLRSQSLQIPNGQKLENSRVLHGALSKPEALHLPENKHLDNTTTPRDQEFILSGSKPSEPGEKARRPEDSYRMSSEGQSGNRAETMPSNSSTLQESTLFPLERTFTNQSPAPSYPEALHEPGEIAQREDSTVPMCTQQLQAKSRDPGLATTPDYGSSLTAVRLDLLDHHSPTSPEPVKLNELSTMDGPLSMNTQQRQLENPPTPSPIEDFSSRRLQTPLTHIPPPRIFCRDYSNHQPGEGSNPTSSAHATPTSRPTSDSTPGETKNAREHGSGRLSGCCINFGSNKRQTTLDVMIASTVPAPSPASTVLSAHSDHSPILQDSDSLDTNTRDSDPKANGTCPSPACMPHIFGANSKPTPASRSIYLRYPSPPKSARSDCSPASLLSLEDLKHYFREKTACL